ncbi:MAG TPA: hypothetical protein ENH21_07315 [Chromatiales bacterium]|nr:hypothetical protein [Chromatiales bacterium]HEX23223.1 hypothetical protein [Chromatiales bacterium]
MKYRGVVYVLVLGFMFSCANEKISNDNDGGAILKESILAAYRDFGESFSMKRSPLLFVGGAVADSCESYFDTMLKYKISETIHNMQVKSEYLVCDALKIISESPDVSVNINTSSMGLDLLSKLDLRTFPNSLSRLVGENSYTLKSLFPENVEANGPVAIVDTDDWIITLEVVAVVQVNNNSIFDWVVQFSDESKSGNYRSYETLIIYDPERADILQAKLYP